MKNKKTKPTIDFTPRYYIKDAMHDNPLGGACSICKRKAPLVMKGVKSCVCDACVTASIGKVEAQIAKVRASAEQGKSNG